MDGKIVARNVAWLDGASIVAGPDRVCRSELTGLRCWRAPEFLEDGRSDELISPPTHSWFVFHPTVDDELLRDAERVTHGAWAGCSDSYCWGSTRTSTAVPICRVGELFVPCALADEATLREFSRQKGNGRTRQLVVGDLYACKAEGTMGLVCVGASREGLFGTADACPSELRASWPSLRGGVPAPHATCSRSPVLAHPGYFSAVYGSSRLSAASTTPPVEAAPDLRAVGAVGRSPGGSLSGLFKT